MTQPYVEVIRCAWRTSPAGTMALALTALAGAVMPIALAIATGSLIGSLPALATADSSRSILTSALTTVTPIGAFMLAAGALEELRTFLGDALGRRVDVHLQQRLMRAASVPPEIAYLESGAAQDQIARVREAVSAGWWTPGGALAPIASNAALALQIAGAAALVAWFQVWLAGALLAAWLACAVVLRRAFLLHTRASNEQATLHRRAAYLRDLALTGPAAKELRLWGMLDWLTERFTAEWWRTLAPQWRARGTLALPSAGVVFAFNAVLLIALAAAGTAAAHGQIDLAALGLLVAAIMRIDPLAGLNADAMRLARGVSSLPAIWTLERHAFPSPGEPPAQRSAPPSTLVLPPSRRLPSGAPSHEVAFDRVTFQYPSQPAPSLCCLDLRIPAGTSLAIVGANGAGKTTLVKLLCRLYQPTGGRILVDGIDLAATDPQDWQRRVAAIFQDFVRFELNARDNVRLGAIHSPAGDAALDRAAQRAGADSVVQTLPHGWDTILARQYEGGTDLSGGEWQRIALARALYAVEAGARVLILDEPTASLDARAEAAFYERFLDLTRGLTTLLISHRFSSVRRADTICVLSDGAIAERGTHAELLAVGGEYARLFALQAAALAASPTGRPEPVEGPSPALPRPPGERRPHAP